MNKKYLIWIFVLLLISSVTALNFEKSAIIDLKIPCENDGKPCGSGATCNITIKYPNSTFLVEYEEMTNQDNGDFNITLDDTKTSIMGEYRYSVYCIDGGYSGAAHGTYMITLKGIEMVEGQGMPLAAIIILPMLFAFLLLIAAATTDNKQHGVLKIFLFLLSIIPFFTSLHFSLVTLTNYYNFTMLENAIGNTTYWVTIIFGVIITYFIIYLFYNLVHLAAQKKKERLKY